MPNPKTDDAAILRALRTDSETLRYAEWWVRTRIYGLGDDAARQLYNEYATAYKVMKDALSGAYDRDGDPIMIRRNAMLAQIEAEMDRLLAQMSPEIAATLTDAFQQGRAGRAWVLDQATLPGIDVNYPVMPLEAIRAATLSPYLGKRWPDVMQYERDVFVQRVRSSITQSMIAGESMAQAQRRLRDELGIQTDRRKGFKRNFWRTLLITRTEIMRASNLGALSIYEQNQDILQGWEWVATKDERTCPICGRLDGKTFEFGNGQSQPPSGSHPGCRCTIVPWLRDTALMDRALGRPRETYCEWAAKNGIYDDASLCTQRGAGQPRTADPIVRAKSDSQRELERAMAENRAALFAARDITPGAMNTGKATGPLVDYMWNFFAYDNNANPTFNNELVDKARLDTLFNIYTLGRGQVKQQTINDVRMQCAAILAADEFLDKSVLSKADRLKLIALASPNDDVVLAAIDDMRDRRLKGTLAQKEEAARNRGKSYDAFVSAEAADGAQRLREANMPYWAQK